MNSNVFNIDCLEGMRLYPDKYFDLALLDPPFGIGQNWTKDRKSSFYKHRNKFNETIPGQEYFEEVFRVSKNQIIWGANYYWNYLTPSNNLIFWDKGKDAKTQFGSAGELAWTSFSKFPFLKYSFYWNGCCVCEPTVKIHPHQKPIKLYRQCLLDFPNPFDKILDTHVGSQSSRIAAYGLGFEFTGFELDEKYYREGNERFAKFVAQPLFDTVIQLNKTLFN